MEMVIGILGLIATIVFGVLSIDLFKRKRRPCRLSYFPSEAISLYRNLTKGFDNLEITMDKKPIKNNVVFLSGFFANSGDIDIKGTENVVKMQLPEGFKWLEVQLDSCSDGIEANFSIPDDTPSIATLNFGLFRVNEFIKFQALVEYEKKKEISTLYRLHRKISFSHRIEDTGDVENGEIVRRHVSYKRLLLPSLIMILLLFGYILCAMLFLNSDNLIYRNNSTNKEYSCMMSDDNMIELQSRSLMESLFELRPEKIAVKEFTSQYTPVYQYKQMNVQMKGTLCVIVFMLIMCSLVTILSLIKIRRVNKLYSLYISSEKEAK